jgi:type I site-specific restriction endonuclease
MELKKYEVPVDKLRWECDPKMFDFKCTSDLAPLREFIGQERATRAVEFGINMTNSGYNIYVAGLTGTGKTSMVKSYIERVIKEREAHGETFHPDDWCYVYNFKEPDSPQIVSLPQGKGKAFREEITDLLNKIRQGLGQAFSSEEYQKQRQKTTEEVQAEQQKLFEEISGDARRQGFIFQMTPAGPALIPMAGDHPMQEQEYLALDEDTRKQLNSKQAELLKKLKASFETASSVQTKAMERLQKLDKDIGEYTVSGLFGSLFEQ